MAGRKAERKVAKGLQKALSKKGALQGREARRALLPRKCAPTGWNFGLIASVTGITPEELSTLFALAAPRARTRQSARSPAAQLCRRRQIPPLRIALHFSNFVALRVMQMHLKLVKGDIDIIFTLLIDRPREFQFIPPRMATIAQFTHLTDAVRDPECWRQRW